MSIREAIEKLQRVKERLSQPQEFYRAHHLEWEELARQVAATVLMVLKPPDVTAVAWQQKIAEVSARIASSLLSEEETGVRIFMLPEGEAPPENAYVGVYDFDTIVKWVNAGVAGEPLGKRLGKIDEGQSDREIAWRVFHAIRLQKSEGLKAAIDAFARASGEIAVRALYGEILKAWREFFAVRAAADWRAWVRRIAAD